MHLHLHSTYSVIDGRGQIEDYLELAEADHQEAMALTDHGTLGGAIDFYTQANKHKTVKPIIGMEMYVDVAELREKNWPGHITVLAKNEAGYRALIAANNLAHNQFYYRPRITLQQLIDSSLAKDWIVLSGCMSSPIYDYPFSESVEILNQLNKHSSGLFLEFMWHYSDDEQYNVKQDMYLEKMAAFHKATGLPMVITNDCHYSFKHHEDIHRELIAQSIDPEGLEFDGEGFYFKTHDQMQRIANDLGIPNALDNAIEISKSCSLVIPEVDKVEWYVPDITGGFPKEKIIRICEATLSDKVFPEEYWERYRYELSVLCTSDAILNSYLVAYDVVCWCNERNIPIAARGSMAGSLISYLLGITFEDPIKYKLSFNRAVNPARPTIPDFDLDVSSIHRAEILEYLKERYENNIPIAAYSHYGPKGAFRKILRMEGLKEFKDVNELSKELPNDWPERYKLVYNKNTKDYEYPPEVEEDLKAQKEAIEVGGARGQAHETIRIKPNWLVNIPKNYWNFLAIYDGLYASISAHPSGVLVGGTERELGHEIPMQWVASSKQLVSAYDMYTLKKMGLFKLDVLGLRTLDQLAYMAKVSGAVVPDDNYDDPLVLKAFGSDLLAEIFQMDGYACREVIKNIHGIESFEDIIAANTLARPGCAQFTPYYRSGFESLIKEYPSIMEILQPTNGLILYQEQVMEIARVLADFNDSEQDDVKEAIKYFRHEVWTKTIEPKFRERCLAKGINADNILSAISRMASYTYNRAHAMTYAAIAYKMMWYKIHYPVVYYAAVYDDTDDKQRLLLESHFFKIKWNPPDVNNSQATTVVKDGQIYLGLMAIKGVGPAAYDALVKARPFSDITDLEARVEKKRCNTSVVQKLKDAFACASIGTPGRQAAFFESFGFNHRYLDYELSSQISGMDGPNNLAGFITDMRYITIKKPGPNEGKEMCMLSLVNAKGKHKCVIFPDTWKTAKGKFFSNDAIIFQGEYQVDGSFIVAHGDKIG